VIVDGTPSECLARANKVLNEEAVAEFERNVLATDDQTAHVSIQPNWARCYDVGTGQLSKLLTTLVDHAST
jgi:hypothetical protein